MSKKSLKLASLICFITCVLLWVPNVLMEVSSPLWILTFVIGPIGLAFGLVGKQYVLAVFNLIMTFSFFWIMALGYYFLGP
ncbi:hypothetical protein M3936_13135 [Sutcliffiella horikoshii]|uniref:hypothetical protein n=1 Tax=Sutcliffiella horikoshii TaxID=79883 RepID=UPI00203F8649|nr:hypothetical protein [Sutcliffiella horikoshii]MCM3618527.1 hypothetical protein [Sutcliffiella horikoshii]